MNEHPHLPRKKVILHCLPALTQLWCSLPESHDYQKKSSSRRSSTVTRAHRLISLGTNKSQNSFNSQFRKLSMPARIPRIPEAGLEHGRPHLFTLRNIFRLRQGSMSRGRKTQASTLEPDGLLIRHLWAWLLSLLVLLPPAIAIVEPFCHDFITAKLSWLCLPHSRATRRLWNVHRTEGQIGLSLRNGHVNDKKTSDSPLKPPTP